MTIWLTSDTHFNHFNIIGYCNRPFSSVKEMDWELVRRWNAVVQPQDKVYHLGDVHMGASRGYIDNLLSQLNGHKRLILGNHDKGKDQTLLKFFDKIQAMRFLKVGDKLLQLTHMPLHPDSIKKGWINVHGHIHNKESPDGPYKNVCVEMTDYFPIKAESI